MPEGIQTLDWVLQAGAAGVLLLGLILVLRGEIVPRYVVLELEKWAAKRDEQWQKALTASNEQNAELKAENAQMRAVIADYSKTTTQLTDLTRLVDEVLEWVRLLPPTETMSPPMPPTPPPPSPKSRPPRITTPRTRKGVT